MEHKVIYDKVNNPGAVLKKVVNGEEYVLVDLFPYKIKNRDLFYQRDHPENLEPDSFLWDKYWLPFAKKCIEGTWVKDKDTWVFMPPKLFFFINYLYIEDEEKNTIQPWLTDIEWIFASYWMCCEGFSGFEGDPKYTSHYLAKKAHDGDLDEIEESKIPPSCFYRGKLKTYVDPWTFLTKTYLIDDPRSAPLGRPLYSPSKEKKGKENSGITERTDQSNFLTIGCRGVHKSVFMMGVLYHEFATSGVRFWENIEKRSRAVKSVAVGPEGQQFQRSLDFLKSSHTKHPGFFRFDKKNVYKGMFYKNTQGTFTYKQGNVEHVVKDGSGTRVHNGASIQIGTLQKENLEKLIGGRVQNILVEEIGLVGGFLKHLMAATEDTLSVSGKATGKFIGLGTSGNLGKFENVKPLMIKPQDYNIFGIPNWWENPSKSICLFLSLVYKFRDYEDENGNIYIEQAFDKSIDQHRVWSEGDSEKATLLKLNNPIMPRHTMIPNMRSLYPKEESASQLVDMENGDLYEKFARAGSLHEDPTQPYNVRFDQDPNFDKVIREMNPDFNHMNGEGRFVIFEPVQEFIPINTYFVIFDPVSNDDIYGSSSCGIIVYKHHRANKGWLTDGIAAVWKGRYRISDKNYEQVIKISKYFGNAKIWFENNAKGFRPWCRKNNYLHLLMPAFDALAKEDSNPYKVKGSAPSYGYILGRNKGYAEERFCQWLLEVRARDENGTILKRNINYIYSIMLHEEIKAHTKGGNYDLLSAGWGLGLLLDALEEDFVPEEDVNPYEGKDVWEEEVKLGMNRGTSFSGYNTRRSFERL